MNKSSYSLLPSKNKHLYKLSITDMHFCNWIFQLFFCAAVIVPFVTLPALPLIVIYVNIWFYVKIWKYEFVCHFPNLINRGVSMCVIMWNKSTPSPPCPHPTPVMWHFNHSIELPRKCETNVGYSVKCGIKTHVHDCTLKCQWMNVGAWPNHKICLNCNKKATIAIKVSDVKGHHVV